MSLWALGPETKTHAHDSLALKNSHISQVITAYNGPEACCGHEMCDVPGASVVIVRAQALEGTITVTHAQKATALESPSGL